MINLIQYLKTMESFDKKHFNTLYKAAVSSLKSPGKAKSKLPKEESDESGFTFF